MNQPLAASSTTPLGIDKVRYGSLTAVFFAGLLLPLGFAPFHFPGLAILGMAMLYAQLTRTPITHPFLTGFIFGLGFLGFGVSWVYVSIHEYGHLNTLVSGAITLLFVSYLSIFPGLVALTYKKLSVNTSMLFSCFLFSSIWCLSEYLRSTFLSGFPWLLLGFGQMDTPLKHLLPIIGIYGVSFFTCLAATVLATSQFVQTRRFLWLLGFVSILVTPSLLNTLKWTTLKQAPLSVGVIQANLSMRDKWDEALFWQLLQRYKDGLDQLVGKKALIVMPESAIPLPEAYVSDFLDTIDRDAKHLSTSVLLGIPQADMEDDTHYYNRLMALGEASGQYLKQHIVPFGEYIPKPFERIMRFLGIPFANLKPGERNQPLIEVNNHPIATLICYELAYPELLRKQLPKAEWIVSISDDGWFGHSLAIYQQLEMAQVLSLQTGRFQVVSNNDGLSSVINEKGEILASLPAFNDGILESELYPATGATPWTFIGDLPFLLFSLLFVILAVIYRKSSLK